MTATVDARLVAPALACWGAAGVVIAIPQAAAVIALVLWLAAGAGGTAALWLLRSAARAQTRGRATAGGIVVCLAAAAVAASAIAFALPTRQPPALTDDPGSHVITAVAQVDSLPQRAAGGGAFDAGGRVRFRATLSQVDSAAGTVAGRMPVLVTARGVEDAERSIDIGATVTLKGTLRPAAPEERSAFFLNSSEPASLIAPATGVLSSTNLLRAQFSAAARALPGDGGALLPGLSIGDVSAVGDELDTSMKLSSLSHLTAVSGANCAVVIAVMMLVTGLVGLGRTTRVVIALTALLGFVVLVTPGPSVLRAAVMATIVVFSMAAGRPGRGIPALCAAVIALLVADPWMARDYGFALSVLATAGLLVLAPPLARSLGRHMPHALAAAIALPLAAQLACQPVLILLNPSVPLYGVGANLLAEPAAPIATVLGLIACLLMPWAPGIGYACAQVAWLPSAWIAAVADVCASLPASQLPWLGGAAGLAAMALMVAIVIFVAVPGRPESTKPAPPAIEARRAGHRLRAVAGVALVVFCGCYLGAFVATSVGSSLGRPGDWQLAACDIGQGDAVLLQDGDAHGLVDVGPEPKPLTACLDSLGVARIDLLVLTHYDRDHVGGVDAVVGRVGIALVGRPTDAHGQSIVDALARGGADVRFAASGDHGSLGRLEWHVLWPSAGARTMQTGNEGSVTVSFAGRGIRSVFLGDLDEGAQDALLRSGRVGSVDVVKVAHHGSADQSERLYRALGARLALISVGAKNSYGHPTERLLGILRRMQARAVRTDVQGLALVSSSAGGTLELWTQRQVSSDALQVPGVRR
ncbi:ComEC/Rec2 family competence protein [Rathayibacter soli]|uniref:ComEC/Rec2 family competence protein n=1 Tax=Rathayibacter soli TaxID=3144168 RepID=UPI0027E57048|nr:ComEC/Rec2 family competence protein [Glaciibacter superstes]